VSSGHTGTGVYKSTDRQPGLETVYVSLSTGEEKSFLAVKEEARMFTAPEGTQVSGSWHVEQFPDPQTGLCVRRESLDSIVRR
jgi:hypothetical protein